ncbi:MAG: PAS domain-containing protein [Actinomycetota bacterium]|nr:PAS domain-containing protein [Actinomycetota bacterium]MCL6093789.1 PAS domain-containing protein [Actinomycetota bacterium]MDA8166625.1 PAS domain-containing protein [Actinomycetota bacterium]
MKNFRYESELFEAFIKTVQYVVSLNQLQEVEEHLSLFLTAHFPASWIVFVRKEPDGAFSLPYYTLDDSVAVALTLKDEFRELAGDVLASGFMATAVLAAPEPSMTVLLPVVVETEVSRVMLIGHAGTEPVPNQILNVYLAISGMVGAAFERIYYEQELNRHRQHLEELVHTRTAALEREIAERKQAQRMLHEERERLAVTLGSIGDGVIATDVDENVVMINKVAQELTGWTEEGARGRPLLEVFDIVNEVTGARAVDPVRRALDAGTIVGLANHTVLISRDGRRHSIADSCAPIRTVDGTVIGAVLVFRDVSEEKRAARLRDSLNEINASINSTLDYNRIMQSVVVKAAEAIGCQSASIEMRRDGFWELRYLYGLPPEMIGMRIRSEIAMAWKRWHKQKKHF